jgi:choline-sulfatase
MLDIDTPHLDTLVERGATFTHAFNMGAWNGAVCVASRRMLNTGRFVWQANAANVEEYVKENRFWSQRMKQAGYQTYMTGKWHVPTDAAGVFDEAKNVRGGMPNQTPQGYDRPKSPEDYAAGWKPWDPQYGGFWKGGKHWSEVVADDGVGFLQEAAGSDKPFFMYLAFNAAHDPRQSPKEYIDRYPLSRIKLPENFLSEYPYAEAICGKGLRDERLMPYPRTEYAVKVNRQEYFALITHMDDQIGRILQTLEETGLADNTYIIFTADHGLAVGHHGLVGKQNQYDDSVRVPFMLVGPNVKAGTRVDSPIYLQDAMATALELAGAKSDGVDFKSVLPLLSGETAGHYDSIYGAYTKTQRMITKGDWKLISYPTIGVQRLYNLKNDPMEMNDLAGNPEYGPKRAEMSKALDVLSQELDDPLLNKEPAELMPEAKIRAAAQPLTDGSLRLKAADATLHSNAEKGINYSAKLDRIGNWRDTADSVEWTVAVATAGDYMVTAELGIDAPSALSLSLGEEQTIEYIIPSTGGYKNYKVCELGKVTVDNAGEYKLVLTPVKQGWHPVNLRSVTLTPAE